MDEVDPFVHKAMAGVLFEAVYRHACHVGALFWMMATPSAIAANSKSLLDNVPDGFDEDTKCAWMSGGNSRRKASGWGKEPWVVFTQKPPHPEPEASTALAKSGGLGTKEATGTG
jgi:hypothetical protein